MFMYYSTRTVNITIIILIAAHVGPRLASLLLPVQFCQGFPSPKYDSRLLKFSSTSSKHFFLGLLLLHIPAKFPPYILFNSVPPSLRSTLHKPRYMISDISTSSCPSPYPIAACPQFHVGCRLDRERFTFPT